MVPTDCAGVEGGTAYIDNCGTCVGGGTTGKISCCAIFEAIMESVLRTEGGYSNDPEDYGEPTNKGISWDIWKAHAQTTLGKSPTLANLKALTHTEATAIYKAEYWGWSRVSEFQNGDLARMFFDFFVNAPVRATEQMQRALKSLGYSLGPYDIDGDMGDYTVEAINQAIADGKIVELTNTFKNKMWEFYEMTANIDPSQQKFEDGWKNRVNKYSDKTESTIHNLYCDV